MRIGILTFQFADNYGAVLQSYALKKCLEANGKNTVLIMNYVNSGFRNAYSINPLKKKGVKEFIKSCILYPKKSNQSKKFDCFRRNELGICENEKEKLDFSKYDVVVVGSDQVWNMQITFNDLNYFLPISERDIQVRRVSYAASADDAFPENRYAEAIYHSLAGFKAISVRENQLKLRLKETLKMESTLVCDPVFLQKKEFWEEFGGMLDNIHNKYILLYILKENQYLEAYAKRLSEDKTLSIIVIHPQVRKISKIGKLMRDIGPREFVALIRNAEYVISNSFHAFAFSLIFSKRIIFDCLAGTANRILSLMKTLEIDSKDKGNGIRYAELRQYGSKKYISYTSSSISFINEHITNEGEIQ